MAQRAGMRNANTASLVVRCTCTASRQREQRQQPQQQQFGLQAAAATRPVVPLRRLEISRRNVYLSGGDGRHSSAVESSRNVCNEHFRRMNERKNEQMIGNPLAEFRVGALVIWIAATRHDTARKRGALREPSESSGRLDARGSRRAPEFEWHVNKHKQRRRRRRQANESGALGLPNVCQWHIETCAGAARARSLAGCRKLAALVATIDYLYLQRVQTA